jgi:hypothetical protein
VIDSTIRRLAKASFASIALLFLAASAVFLTILGRGDTTWRQVVPYLGSNAVAGVFPVVGLVILRRHPRNAVGWVLLGVGLSWQLGFICDAYAAWGFAYPGSVPGPAHAMAISATLWVPGIAPLGTFLILLFPDGHLPTPQWRWWARFVAASQICVFVAITFAPGVIDDARPEVLNPLGIELLGRYIEVLLASVLLIPIGVVGCAVALVRRYRRSTGVQRMQLKWFAAAGGVVAASYGAAMIASIPYEWAGEATPTWLDVLQIASLATFILIPIAVGVAITRYHLYDIDRLINKALVYSAGTGLLAALYFGGVVGTQSVLRGITGSAQNNLAVAVSTLIVAALFRPVLVRVQSFVDRRFYRSKYDAARTVEAFSAHLRQETDLAALSQQLRGVVTQTVQPAGVSLWIAAPARKG